MTETKIPWEVTRTHGKSGTGQWTTFSCGRDEIWEAAAHWHENVRDVDKPWLCWNMHDRWCVLQQRLILEQGWTPVIGWDPNCGLSAPPLEPGAIAVDFNAKLQLPVLFPHVPLEFAFLWSDRLAFWHADLLLTRKKLKSIVNGFESIHEGQMAAVYTWGGWRNWLRPKYHRYWELIGCTTAGASRHQFETGTGWWRHIESHWNCPNDVGEIARRKSFYDDHGCGIRYWEKYYGGRAFRINERYVSEGHFSAIGSKDYKRGDSKAEEMDLNFDLPAIAKRLGIDDVLPAL